MSLGFYHASFWHHWHDGYSYLSFGRQKVILLTYWAKKSGMSIQDTIFLKSFCIHHYHYQLNLISRCNAEKLDSKVHFFTSLWFLALRGTRVLYMKWYTIRSLWLCLMGLKGFASCTWGFPPFSPPIWVDKLLSMFTSYFCLWLESILEQLCGGWALQNESVPAVWLQVLKKYFRMWMWSA